MAREVFKIYKEVLLARKDLKASYLLGHFPSF